MSMKILTKAVLATAIAAAPFAGVHAQFAPAPQPYNPQDPQNYSAPAQQSYRQNAPQQQAYPQQPQQGNDPNGYAPPPPQNPQDEANYEAGQEAIAQAPPPLPEYDQPIAPGPGYIWTPGYWAWGPAGYYWVPGAWVEPPYQEALWTPGYWGCSDDGFYFWNAGYWGPTVGFYGGINYGFGYFGTGFYGGYWRGGLFFYNAAYWHVGPWPRYIYTQRYPGIYAYHPGAVSFVHHREALALRGGEAFGSHATIGAYRAGFRPTPGFHAGIQGFGNFRATPPRPGMAPNGYRSGPAPQPHSAGPVQQQAPAPQPRVSAPSRQSAPAPAPHTSGGGGSSHSGGHR